MIRMNEFFTHFYDYMKIISYANLMPLILLVIFSFIVIYNPVFNQRQGRLFLAVAIINIIMILSTILDYILTLETGEHAWWQLRTFTTFFNFCIGPIIPLIIYKITTLEKLKFWLYIPFWCNVFICSISIFIPLVFNVSKLNIYGRGPLFYLPFATIIFYIICIAIKTGKSKLHGKQKERLLLLAIAFILSLVMFLEVKYRYYFMIWTSTAICIPLYYFLLNINQSILDPLTGTYNRLMYIKELSNLSQKKNGIIASLDINDLKVMNDTKGHEAGDQLLITFANLINENLPNQVNLFRIGGDEFIILSRKDNYKKVKESIDHARLKMQGNVSFSYSIEQYTPNQDMTAFLDNLDKKLYQNKKDDKLKEKMAIH